MKSFLDHIEGQYESQQTSAVFQKSITVSQMQLLFTYRIPEDPVTPGMSCKRKTLSTSKSGGLLLSTMFVLPFQTIPKAPEVSWVNFCWVCATGLSEPQPRYSLFCGQI